MPDLNQKVNRYKRLYKQLCQLLLVSPSIESQLATINAILYHKIPYIFWIGFYLYRNNRLLVGPYQGPLACQELAYPKGACWHSVIHKESLIIPDVSKFHGHIACDARSKSELVIPIFLYDQDIFGVLDIDSNIINAFDEVDLLSISDIIGLIKPISSDINKP